MFEKNKLRLKASLKLTTTVRFLFVMKLL